MSHGKIVCSKCSDIIAQCRCINTANHTTTYGVCNKCKPGSIAPHTSPDVEPSAEALEAATRVVRSWDYGGVEEIPDIARALDTFAFHAVQTYRRKNADKDALGVAASIRERIWAERGKVGMGVTDQHIANDLEHFAAQRVAEDREAQAPYIKFLEDKIRYLVELTDVTK